MEARLGRVARRIRKDAGLTLLDLAPAAGVSQSTLTRFERGEVSSWKATNAIVAVYAEVGGIEVEDLWRQALEDGDA